jgi:hypothetical protein
MHKVVFLVAFMLQTNPTRAQNINGVPTLSLEYTYVAAETPQRIIYTFNHANGVGKSTSSTNRNEISFDVDRALFGGDQIVTCVGSHANGAAAPLFIWAGEANTCITNTGGTKLIGALDWAVTTASIAANVDFSLTITEYVYNTGLAGLPTAGAVQLTNANVDFQVTTAQESVQGTLPSSYSQGTTAQTDAATTLPVDAFYTIAAPALTIVDGGNMNAGTAWVSLQVVVSAPIDVPNPSTMQFTFSKEVLNSGQTTGVTVNSGFTLTSMSTTSSYLLTMDTGSAIPMGTSVDVTLSTPLATALPHSNGPVYLTVRFASVVSALDASGFGTILNAVVSDPITMVNGSVTKFWIPPDVFSPLFVAPDCVIMVLPLLGPTEDLQWFDRFLITRPDGGKIADIGIRRQLTAGHSGNRSSRFRRGFFNQLEVRLWGNKRPEERLRQVLMVDDSGTIKIGLGSQKLFRPRTHSGDLAEYIYVETPTTSFVVFASHAGNEFPYDLHLQRKYTHLDLISLNMDSSSYFSGILPELWGSIPMSEEVAAMLIPPSATEAKTNFTASVCEKDACEDGKMFITRT